MFPVFTVPYSLMDININKPISNLNGYCKIFTHIRLVISYVLLSWEYLYINGICIQLLTMGVHETIAINQPISTFAFQACTRRKEDNKLVLIILCRCAIHI